MYIDGPHTHTNTHTDAHTHTHMDRQLHSVKRRNKRNVIIKYKTNKGKSSLHFTCLPRIVGANTNTHTQREGDSESERKRGKMTEREREKVA